MKELIKIQSELKAPKNQFNNFGKYKYRSAEDILEAVKPLLAKNNCIMTISDSIQEVAGRFYVQATATITNEDGQSVSVQAYAREADSKSGMDASQITGSCSSYARKYALNGLFLIDDTKDADTDEQQKQTTAKPKKAVKKEENDEMKDAILADIKKMQTREDLTKIWRGYQTLQKEDWFIEAVQIRGAEIGK